MGIPARPGRAGNYAGLAFYATRFTAALRAANALEFVLS